MILEKASKECVNVRNHDSLILSLDWKWRSKFMIFFALRNVCCRLCPLKRPRSSDTAMDMQLRGFHTLDTPSCCRGAEFLGEVTDASLEKLH